MKPAVFRLAGGQKMRNTEREREREREREKERERGKRERERIKRTFIIR